MTRTEEILNSYEADPKHLRLFLVRRNGVVMGPMTAEQMRADVRSGDEVFRFDCSRNYIIH